MGKPNVKRWSLIVIGLGTILLAVGLFLLVVRLHIILFGISAEATVVSNRSKSTEIRRGEAGNGMASTVTVYYPTVTFRDPNSGELVRRQVETGSRFYDFVVGEKVTVRYLPEHPKEFYLGRVWIALMFPVIFTVSGIFVAFMGITARRIIWPKTPTNS